MFVMIIKLFGLIAQILSLLFVLKKTSYQRDTQKRLQYVHYTILSSVIAGVLALMGGNFVTTILNLVLITINAQELK